MDPLKKVEWFISKRLIDYKEAENFMEKRANQIARGVAPETIWLLEHPSTYTAGISANSKHLKEGHKFTVYKTKRGGQYTYHGPGQRVVYVMLNLKNRGKDVRLFVKFLENWIISALKKFNVEGHIRKDRVGVWVERTDKSRKENGNIDEDKIAAIGIRLYKWVSYHGFSINVDPQLDHFEDIIPCGISEYGVTSLSDLGLSVAMEDIDLELLKTFDTNQKQLISSPTL